MQRDLPARPRLQHLKKQAKELLDAHRRGDRHALQRIGETLPSLAGRTPDEIAAARFALHDAQSVIAREHGFRSWTELRAELDRLSSRAMLEGMLAGYIEQPLPEAVITAVTEAWPKPGIPVVTPLPDLPHALPLLAARNVLLFPRSITPMHVGRAVSIAAVEAALGTTPATLAVFAQRDPSSEELRPEALHGVGCQVLVRSRFPAQGGIFVVLEGLRWIRLAGLEPAVDGGGLTARVALARTGAGLAQDEDGDGDDVLAQEEALRDRARRLVHAALPEPRPAIALLDAIGTPDLLADVVMSNLRCPVADKAGYASQNSLRARLRIANALVQGQLDALAR